MSARLVVRLTFASVLPLLLPAGAVLAANGDCGIPSTSGAVPKASDCLFILRSGVGLQDCDLCICDTNGSTKVTSSDSLLCLRRAVGQAVNFDCPPCDTTTTTPPTTTTLPPPTTTLPPTTTTIPPTTTTTVVATTTTTAPDVTTTTIVEPPTTTLPPTTTTTVDATTTTLPPPGGPCPGVVQWTNKDATGPACDDDSDCSVGFCDAGGRCRSVAELDLGWTGAGHDIDLNRDSTMRVSVDCPNGAEGGSCGACQVTGLDPSDRSCRCSNDFGKVCDEQGILDKDSCPTCLAGAFAGLPCAGNVDCSAGTCSRRCDNNAQIACTKKADCGVGNCAAATTCSNGRDCNADSQCTGTCTTGSLCQCFDGPPLPLVAGGLPLCIVSRYLSDVTGTVNVDTGASSVTRDLRTVVYGGESREAPCPYCGGTCSNDAGMRCAFDVDCGDGNTCNVDPTPRDGVRGGVCVAGDNDGDPCDVQALNPSFATRPGGPRGSGVSLDCMPRPGANISGSGLKLKFVESTADTQAVSQVPCAASPSSVDCLCRVCSGDATVACDSDADCAAAGGTCTSVGPSGVEPKTNSCVGGSCLVIAGEGQCETGPDDWFCDGLLQSNGRGIYPCGNNADCEAGVTGFEDSLCTVGGRRNCFGVDPAAFGDADPERPVTSALFCVPTLSTAGRNQLLGLPGPGRVRRQSALTEFCAAGSDVRYYPGVGGCSP